MLMNCSVSSCADGSPLRSFYKKTRNVDFLKAPALLRMALANARQEPAKRWLEHHARADPAAKSMLIDL